MTDPHEHRIMNPQVLSIDPQKSGSLRLEVFAGVEVEFRRRSGIMHHGKRAIYYDIAVYKSGKKYRRTTRDFNHAVSLLEEAIRDPKGFRE